MQFVLDGSEIRVIGRGNRHLDEAVNQPVKINFDRFNFLLLLLGILALVRRLLFVFVFLLLDLVFTAFEIGIAAGGERQRRVRLQCENARQRGIVHNETALETIQERIDIAVRKEVEVFALGIPGGER